jgi:hypothetical protein
VDSNIQILRLTGKALGQVFTGKRSVRNTLSGPIGIYQAAQKSSNVSAGTAYLGCWLFEFEPRIFNLLPIPVLDGGAIFLLLIEGIAGSSGLSILDGRSRSYPASRVCHGSAVDGFCDHNDVLKTFGGGIRTGKTAGCGARQVSGACANHGQFRLSIYKSAAALP